MLHGPVSASREVARLLQEVQGLRGEVPELRREAAHQHFFKVRGSD